MKSKQIGFCLRHAMLLIVSGVALQAQEGEMQFPPDHSDCTFLGSQRERFVKSALKAAGAPSESRLSLTTRQVSARIASRPTERAASFANAPAADSIDSYILSALQSSNIAPADKTDDYTFLRRVTLDLTGRIPTPDSVTKFVTDTTPNKRAALIDQLLNKPEWVDKWTMYFGDLYQNNATNLNIQRRNEGRNAFYKYIHDSLAANKPYNQIATEMISAQGGNSYDQTDGQMNWIVGNVATNGPVQDTFDSQTAALFEEFMGMSHVNCLLCHNGAGHLDTLNLWASKTSRYQAWQLSAFMAKTWVHRISVTDPNQPTNNNLYYYELNKYTTDYALNTTTGNRPSRLPLGVIKTVTPSYIFTGDAPAQGQDYRATFATYVTKDPQFARATVNYLWAYFFGMGIVDPPDQFDLARLDPNNPPPAPWTLQPSNPALLNALAQHFINSGFDIKALMREIVNSETYQLSSEYSGQWNATYEPFFARKFVRRLWSEELHDAVTQATGEMPNYTVNGFSNASTLYTGIVSPGFGPISYAMQLPDVTLVPDNGGAVSQFLDVFLRGDRDTNPRRQDGSILQALDLMNDPFVENRVKATSTLTSSNKVVTPYGLLATNINLPNTQLIDLLYMNALSRHPTGDEVNTAVAKLSSLSPAARQSAAEDLFWTLFNKVDFIFNY